MSSEYTQLKEMRTRLRELKILAAKSSTAELASQVFGPTWQDLWYMQVISDHLEATLRFVRGLPGGLQKLCINIPMQHGKTTMLEMFIARALGIDASLRVINSTYSVNFARERITNCQRVMNHDAFKSAFTTRYGQSTAVSDDDDRVADKVRNTANMFAVRKLEANGKYVDLGGSFLSTSLGASLNGRPYDIGIIDDPHKNMEEAASEAARRRVEERYDAIFLSRQQERSVQIIVTSRLDPNDLVGYVVPRWAKAGIPHAILRFPAILDEPNSPYDPRPQGWGLAQALEEGGPQKYSANFYRTIRAELMDKSPHVWETCYQQRPTTRTGELFLNSWWRYYSPADLKELDRFWISIDCASKATGASWTCADLWASKGPMVFKLDELRGHWDLRQFEREFMNWITEKWGREVRAMGSAIIVEDGGFGRVIHDDMVAAGVRGMHLLGTGGLSKTARATMVLDMVRNGLVHLPSSSFGRVSAGWVDEHKTEYGRFPALPCDRVDAGVQALRWHLDLLRAS